MIVSADSLYLLTEEEVWFTIHVETDYRSYLGTKDKTKPVQLKKYSSVWKFALLFLVLYKNVLQVKTLRLRLKLYNLTQ